MIQALFVLCAFFLQNLFAQETNSITPTNPSIIEIESPLENALEENKDVSVFIVVNQKLPPNAKFHIFLDHESPRLHENAASPCVFQHLEPGGHLLRVVAVNAQGKAIPQAFACTHFFVKTKNFRNYLNLKKPFITLNLPLSGTVVLNEKKRLDLDFIVHNVELGGDSGYRLRCRLNQREMMIDKNEPIQLDQLSYGKNKLTLELLGPDGDPVMNDYAIAQREFEIVRVPKPLPVGPSQKSQATPD